MMNVEPEPIDRERALEILETELHLTDPVHFTNFVRESRLMFSYRIDGRLVAVVGFIPLDLFNRRLYLWMESTELVSIYKVGTARAAIRTLNSVRRDCEQIMGHCVVGSRSIDWLKSLGARFAEPEGQLVPFQIGD